MITWIMNQCDYKYLSRDPDPLVSPMQIHWECHDVDGGHVGRVIGANRVSDDLPDFPESSIVRVSSPVLQTWLHDSMGPEWVAEKEAAATRHLEAAQNPPMGSTPPDDG